MPDRTPAEDARAAAEATQASFDTAGEAGRKMFFAWAAGTEASLRATFEAQNAALQASISVLEATSGASREALQQWAETARQAQQAALEAFRSNLSATEQSARRTRSGRAGG